VSRMKPASSPLLALAVASIAACAPLRETPVLYERLGGEAGIEAIVQELILNIAADDRIRHHFTDLHIAGFRQRLESHFCHLSGGPCDAPERSMRESHENLGIRAGEFNALVEGLILALDRSGVDYRTQNEFLARLVPMQADIVASD